MMTWLFTKAALLVGERFAKPFVWITLAIAVVGIIFALGRCSKDDYKDDYEAQIDQTNRSSDAASDAAAAAIEILDGRTATEDAIDQVVAQTVEQIDGAADADAVRNAVLAGVCGTPEHRNDPACLPSAENHQ